MNIYDLVKRKDRAVESLSGTISVGLITKTSGPEKYLLLSAGTSLLLKRADEFYSLRHYPTDLNWKLHDLKGEGVFSISLVSHLDGTQTVIHKTTVSNQSTVCDLDVFINWPPSLVDHDKYDLSIKTTKALSLKLLTGKSLNPRGKFSGLIKGRGIEVGPGMNPFVKPSKEVAVKYIESMQFEEWRDLYNKNNDGKNKKNIEELWERYIVSDATMIAGVKDESLDFIFSNHVFEHLMNPISVIKNWTRKLKKGGVILGAVPDCRYTFDLRQSPSTLVEVIAEYNEDRFQITDQKYDKWCKFTAPYNTPEDLKLRGYSIHVHFYTSETFYDLCNEVRSMDLISSFFIDSMPNNKDFGFVLKK